MPSWSSYNYTFSNPIKFTDPTGMAPEGSIDPPKWMKKLYKAMKESFSRGHAHKSRVKKFKRDMNSLAKYSGFMDGTGPRDKLEEGISIKTDKPTNGGMVSVPFSDRNADVKIIDESIISATTGLTGKVNGNPKSFIDHVETVVNIADKGQRFSELGSNSENTTINTEVFGQNDNATMTVRTVNPTVSSITFNGITIETLQLKDKDTTIKIKDFNKMDAIDKKKIGQETKRFYNENK